MRHNDGFFELVFSLLTGKCETLKTKNYELDKTKRSQLAAISIRRYV